MRNWTTAALHVAVAMRLAAQTPASPPSRGHFDVVSVKPCDVNPETLEGFKRLFAPTPNTGDRFYKPCQTAQGLIAFAYDVRKVVYGSSAWSSVALEPYEVDARVTSAADLKAMRVLVQGLLSDRWALRAHTELREEQVYALVLARPDGRLGPNLRRTSVDCASFRAGLAEEPVGPDKRRLCSDLVGGRMGGPIDATYRTGTTLRVRSTDALHAGFDGNRQNRTDRRVRHRADV